MLAESENILIIETRQTQHDSIESIQPAIHKMFLNKKQIHVYRLHDNRYVKIADTKMSEHATMNPK